MKFSIIIPTHKRKEKLLRAVASVHKQSFSDWEVIIVNDSPLDTLYEGIEDVLRDPRITYLINEKNSGVNASRNRALDTLSSKTEWIIFLDDDDYLAPDALSLLSEIITLHPKESWIMTNRVTSLGKILTQIPYSNKGLEYAWNFLITKRFKGDATHCIKKNILRDIYFPKTIKQGEEWLFYYELSTHTRFFYQNINTTITEGYEESGLNYRVRSTREQLKTLKKIWKEGTKRNIALKPSFLVYFFMRFVRTFIKH